MQQSQGYGSGHLGVRSGKTQGIQVCADKLPGQIRLSLHQWPLLTSEMPDEPATVGQRMRDARLTPVKQPGLLAVSQCVLGMNIPMNRTIRELKRINPLPQASEFQQGGDQLTALLIVQPPVTKRGFASEQ